MGPNLQQQLLTTAAVICISLIVVAAQQSQQSLDSIISAQSAPFGTTTTVPPQPLQPPTAAAPTTTTTTTSEKRTTTTASDLSDSLEELNKQETSNNGNDDEDPDDSNSDDDDTTEHLLGGSGGFLPTIVPHRMTTNYPRNGHGYIQFEVEEEEEHALRAAATTTDKAATVNEVLSNLFPNGFSDIFRFSYQAESTTTSTTPAAPEPERTTTATTTTTTTPSAVAPPTEEITTTTTSAPPAKNQTSYSYQTTVTKEYRRELRPGHTQIVVEVSSQFKDGSNSISREELQRINRAAVASPVLPSLLMRPETNDDNDTLVAAESAPIVILGEHESELEDLQSFEDNQIAETQHVGHHQIYQRLPPAVGVGESYRSQQGPGQEQHINVHIVHDDSLAKAQSSASEPQLPQSHSLDHYQAHSEQRFQQRHQTHEAPSRQFLKNFKPVLTGSSEGTLPKGAFHYEVNNPPQRPNPRPPTENDYAQEFVRPAAQLAYQRELSHVLREQNSERQQPQQLHTQAVASAPVAPPPSHPSVTPSSLLFVTPQPSPSPAPQLASGGTEIQIGPIYHEVTAESSQQHSHHAPAPVTVSEPAPPSQPIAKPNGYTFVEVQKSVNIHNKLITEKDGRLVEQHETIYHPLSYAQNSVSPPAKNFVSAPTTSAPLNYVSLATNPINVQNVEYDSSPQEGATVHFTTNHHQHHQHPPQSHHEHTPYPVPVETLVDHSHPVKQVVEKQVPVPYAVPHPVPVPVHIEHYVDRPYPVETIVEQPVPYPVETIVEKIVEKHVPVEVERIVEKPVEVEKIVEKIVDRPMPMAIPIHVPVAIRIPMPPSPAHFSSYPPHPNALPPWSHTPSLAHLPPKVLQNYYTRMLKKLLPQLTKAATTSSPAIVKKQPKPLRSVTTGDAPKVATFSLADMRFDLRPPPPPQGSPWLQGARYIYNTLPADLATAAAAQPPTQMIKSYIGPVPATGSTAGAGGGGGTNEFDEFQRWRNGHSLKRSPDFGRNLHMEYGFKPPLVPSMEIDDKGNPLKTEPENQ